MSSLCRLLVMTMSILTTNNNKKQISSGFSRHSEADFRICKKS